MVTVLLDAGPIEVAASAAEGQLWLSRTDAQAVSGWTLKPEGLCRGDICTPVPAQNADHFVDGKRVNLAAFWTHMGKPLCHSEDKTVWAFGESADDRGASLQSLEAPDFTLPDLEGVTHSLSDYRGKKVFLATFASW